jgi:predicted transcriptional regulator
MTMAHIAKAINRSLNTTKKIIGELVANGILEERQGEYYVSRSIISKGETRK